ncbi:MAG: hypothetical protein GEV03_17985 [Streptosporangiales bacterium]|nr:hypothetical protein [Streptosporangiales bacterium]
MKGALDVHRMLLEHGTHHEIVRLHRLVTCADELPQALGLPRERCLAVRMFSADDQLAALIVRVDEAPPGRALLPALGAATIRPAAPDLVNAVTDYAAGLVAPIPLPACVTVLMDRRIVDSSDPDEVVYVPTGEGGTALGIRSFDLFTLSGAKPLDLSSEPHRPAGAADLRPPVHIPTP